jgi:hypothetical protein
MSYNDNSNKIGIQALQNAKNNINKKCKLGINYCLYNVQEWYELGHFYSSAINQWKALKKQHKGDKSAPAGTPVFFQGGKYGHIAIATGTGENIISTDYPNKAYVCNTTISAIEKGWGYAYLGWSENMCDNKTIYTKPKTITPAKTTTQTYKTYTAKTKTKMFKKPSTKSPALKNGKKIYRKKGYKITAKPYNREWLLTSKKHYYLTKRFK